MTLELKDYLAVAALAISIFNFIESRSAKQRSLGLAIEQRRQEVLLIKTQITHLHNEAINKLQQLSRDCERRLQKKGDKERPNRLVLLIRLKIRIYESTRILDSEFWHFGAESMNYSSAHMRRVQHDHLLRFEQLLGETKRKLEEARKQVEEAQKFEIRIREGLRKQADRLGKKPAT
jgi:hypothetical protein